jgi:hypothetical protein
LCTLITTITHDWGPANTHELRDEPIIVIFLMDGNHKGGERRGRMLNCYTRGEVLSRQALGSIETVFFQRLELIINRPFRSSPTAGMLEIDRCEKGAHMIDLLCILSDDEASRTHAVIRMDNDWREPAFDKWGIILTRRGAVMDNFSDPGQLLIREKTIPSPTARAKNSRRANREADENNLRFFDNIENGRSLSRDRNIKSSSGSEAKSRQRSRSKQRRVTAIIDPEIYKSETAKKTLVPDYYLQHHVHSAISLKGTLTIKTQNIEATSNRMSTSETQWRRIGPPDAHTSQ